jgi:endonuclease-8
MPEGHTIHRLSRDLKQDLKNIFVAASSPQGRFAEGALLIDGKELIRSEAWGKHLFLSFGHQQSVDALIHIHLGLIGKFRPKTFDTETKESIRLRLKGNESFWDLTGPQDCRLIDKSEYFYLIERLGPDPLRRGSKVKDFQDSLIQKKVPIGAALLDQSIVAGIGNVYRAEFLFLHGINPNREARKVSNSEAADLWVTFQKLLRIGVRLNRIVTVSQDDGGATSGRLPRKRSLYVYKREGLPCRRCSTEITIGKIGGRSCWWCSVCQPI